MKFAFMLGWIDAALLIGLRLVALLVGRRARGGTAEPKPRELPDAPVPKTGQHAAKASKSRQYNHRSSRTAIHFLSRNCHEPRSAEHQAEIRTFRWRERSRLRGFSVRPPARASARREIPSTRTAREWVGTENGSVRRCYGSVEQFFGTFLISSMLHRDPRYFLTLHGGPGHRIGTR